MSKPYIPIFLCVLMLFSCRQKNNDFNKNGYNIVVKDLYWATIDLNSKVLKVHYDSLKYVDTLQFTPNEEEELFESFNKSGLTDSKGEVQYDPGIAIMPAFYKSIEVFKNNKLISTTTINNRCRSSIFFLSRENRAVQFRDVIDTILKKNKKFIKARELYLKYLNDHHVLFL